MTTALNAQETTRAEVADLAHDALSELCLSFVLLHSRLTDPAKVRRAADALAKAASLSEESA